MSIIYAEYRYVVLPMSDDARRHKGRACVEKGGLEADQQQEATRSESNCSLAHCDTLVPGGRPTEETRFAGIGSDLI